MSTIEGIGRVAFGDPQLVVTHPASAAMRLAGAPFALFGGVAVWLALRANGPTAVHPAVAVIGAVFLLMGLGLLLHVSRRVIHRERGTVDVFRGIAVPFWHKTLPLDGFDQVRLDIFYVSNGQGAARKRYRVSLVSPTGPTCSLMTASRYRQARREAERVSAYVRLPMADHSSKNMSIRQPDELDRPVVEDWRKEGVPAQHPDLPADSRLGVRQDGTELVVDLPRAGLTGPRAVLAAAMLPGLGVPLWLLASDNGFDAGALARHGMFVLPFMLAPFAVMGCLVLWYSASRECVRVGPKRISVVRQLGPFCRRVSIASDALEELIVRDVRTLPPLGLRTGGLILRSDDRTCTVGTALSRDEQSWLVDAIRWAMTH